MVCWILHHHFVEDHQCAYEMAYTYVIELFNAYIQYEY